jgi:L-iditol 2-dehydrogenase
VYASSAAWSAGIGDDDRADIVIEAVGHQVSTLQHCFDGVAFGGQIYYFGVPDDLYYPFPMNALLRNNLTVMSGYTDTALSAIKDANEYLRAHPHLAEDYVTNVYTRQDVQKAFVAAANPSVGQFKVVVIS